MTALYPDYFNDVFGPLMQPGSSSHTAGPNRAGYLCHSLLGEEVIDIKILLDKNSSFSGGFGNMNEDLGMLNGAAGFMPTNPGIFSIKEYLKEHNISFSFEFGDMKESTHPIGMKFILTGKSGKVATLVANSTGGGMVETVLVNGFEFAGKGDTYVLCIFDNKEQYKPEEISKLICDETLESGISNRKSGGIMYWYKLQAKPSQQLLKLLSEKEYGVLEPVLPVPTTAKKREQLFKSMAEWRELADKEGKSMSDVAIDYEVAASGWTHDQVVTYMRDIIMKTMYRRCHAVYEEDVTPMSNPFKDLYYKKWADAIPGLPLDMGVITKSIRYVMAAQVMIPGVLNVPGPMGTGGGFLFGVLSAVKDELNLSDDEVLDALFVSAGVGAIAYTRTSPTGEVIGCAGECGCCTAMTAAAIVDLLNGTPIQMETAASYAMQASIGWPCDPIPGGKNMPCLSRILFIACMSIVYAQWSISGQDAVLPFHEVVDVADKLGRNMSSDLLGSSRGGLCSSPTAKCVSCEFKKWHAKN